MDGLSVSEAHAGDAVEVAMPETGFYLEAGGQVGDEGVIVGDNWQINVNSMRKPAPGLILLVYMIRRFDQAPVQSPD